MYKVQPMRDMTVSVVFKEGAGLASLESSMIRSSSGWHARGASGGREEEGSKKSIPNIQYLFSHPCWRGSKPHQEVESIMMLTL